MIKFSDFTRKFSVPNANKNHAMNTYIERGGKDPQILSLNTRQR
jgi:hypothetical protein